ncbi:MAG: hypothetical protein WCJ75_18025, partial [Desulfomonile sp.]
VGRIYHGRNGDEISSNLFEVACTGLGIISSCAICLDHKRHVEHLGQYGACNEIRTVQGKRRGA